MSGLQYTFPNTGSLIDRSGTGSQGHTTSGLSTQIIIKVNGVPVGALQTLTVRQTRGLQRIKEIGTDGVVEIVPNTATEYNLSVSRIVFDQLRLPEAFSRAFRFISAQRIPFDIDIYDIGNVTPGSTDMNTSSGVILMRFSNCWFTSYETPYAADNYIITESAEIQAENAFVVDTQPTNLRGFDAETDRQTKIEEAVNLGHSRGSLDVSGLLQSIFE